MGTRWHIGSGGCTLYAALSRCPIDLGWAWVLEAQTQRLRLFTDAREQCGTLSPVALRAKIRPGLVHNGSPTPPHIYSASAELNLQLGFLTRLLVRWSTLGAMLTVLVLFGIMTIAIPTALISQT